MPESRLPDPSEAGSAEPERDGVAASEVTGQAYAAAAAILFGSGYVATAFALRSLSPLAVALWRGIIATLVLLPIVVRMRGPAPLPMSAAQAWRVVVLGVSAGLAFVVAMNATIALSGATLAAFVTTLSPVIAAVLAPVVLGESLTVGAVLGFGTAMAGTALLSRASAAGADARGVLVGLVAATSFALFLVLSRRWSRRYQLSNQAIALSIAATTAIGLLPIVVLGEPDQIIPAHVRPDALVGLAWLAFVPGVAAQLLVIAAVRRVETRSSAAVLLISPVSTAILAAALLGETLDAPQLVGAILILGGVLVATGLGPPSGWFDGGSGNRRGERRSRDGRHSGFSTPRDGGPSRGRDAESRATEPAV